MEKTEVILKHKYSLHEAYYLMQLITDEAKNVEDVLSFISYVDKCNSNGIDTDIDEYEKQVEL